MRLQAAFVSMALVFGTIVFMAAMTPTITGLIEAFTAAGAGPEQEAQMERIETIVLRIVPVIFAIGAILFGYVAVAGRQRYAGRGP